MDTVYGMYLCMSASEAHLFSLYKPNVSFFFVHMFYCFTKYDLLIKYILSFAYICAMRMCWRHLLSNAYVPQTTTENKSDEVRKRGFGEMRKSF